MKDLKTLLIELDECSRQLEKIKDPEYIEKRSREVFKNLVIDKTELNRILKEVL